MAYPDVRFVLMHMGYPYQDEYIALAKHFTNVYVDLSFAWILSPLATARFVGEFLTAAPAVKLLAFGGDYRIIEPVVGHARLARTCLARALSHTVESGLFREDEALNLIEPLMRNNALTLFS
jgi:predicted TIM-barrel fold metal-dependent hydrolase